MEMKDIKSKCCCIKIIVLWFVSTIILIIIVHMFLQGANNYSNNKNLGVSEYSELQYESESNFSYLEEGSREKSSLSDREYTKQIVDKSVAVYRSLGLSVLNELNSKNLVDGEWYVYGISPQGIRIFYPVDPEAINIDVSNLTDSSGNNIGKKILNASKDSPDGAWVTYSFTNPENQKEEEKTAYLVQVDNHIIFGSGYYTR